MTLSYSSRTLKRREYSEDRETLREEHLVDKAVYKDLLIQGEDFCHDIEKVDNLISELSDNKNIAREDKESILMQLELISRYIREEYKEKIEASIDDISGSMSYRISDIAEATYHAKLEVLSAEKIVWKTDTVDKAKIVSAYDELYKRYKFLFEEADSDLYHLMKEAKEQRKKIRKHDLRR